MEFTNLSQLPVEEAARWHTALATGDDSVRHVPFILCSADVTLETFLEETTERLNRWWTGLFTQAETAQILARANDGFDIVKFREQMRNAVRSGALIVRKNDIPLDPNDKDLEYLFSMHFRQDDINEWLRSVKARYELTYPYDEDQPPDDLISFSEAARHLLDKHGATEQELAAWMTFEADALMGWLVRPQRDGKVNGRHFSAHDLRVPNLSKGGDLGALPDSITRVITLLKALDVRLSAAQVDDFSVVFDNRFVNFSEARALISKKARNAAEVDSIIQCWADVHAKIRNLESVQDQVGSFLPFVGYAEKLEDGVVLHAQLDVFVNRQLGVISDRTIGWWDATMDAEFWRAQPAVNADQAAMLLSRRNPHEESLEQAITASTDETTPADFRRLQTAFRAIESTATASRTLDNWYAYAKEHSLKVHSWFGLYVDLVTAPASAPAVARIKEPQVDQPWLVADSADPKAAQLWYTPARYFARLLAKGDPSLLQKRNKLADKAAQRLKEEKIEGSRKKFVSGQTLLKALANCKLD